MSDPGLQTALDNNYERRLKARLGSYDSLPEQVGIMRKRAHEIRSAVIANLGRYVDQFERAAAANGMLIHRAANTASAVEIVLEIARANNVKLVAKAKTMMGEEIRLNQAFEQAGIESVETDLGEYIVQIRGERPAHIITPAVHLRRGDVGRTFHEKLGIPYTEDVPTLTSAARDRLREVFLKADMGVTGVNLGVAETGAIGILSNEGNGRLVASLPRIHVALMGIERLVPNMNDLAAILYLLPRSATGQKLTVYTNLVRSPRHPGDPDGPQERHIILVDNGRRALLNSPLQESLLCVRCGACLNICPIFREVGGHAYIGPEGQVTPYPGPIGSILSPALFGYADFGHLARACSLCGACKEACPVDIDLPGMLLRVRGGKVPEPAQLPNTPASLNLGLRIFTWLATSTSRFRFAQRMAGLFGRLLAPRSGWLRMPAFSGWGISRDFPRPAAHSFSQRWVSRQGGNTDSLSLAGSRAEKAPAGLPGSQEEPLLTTVEWFGRELTGINGIMIACTRAELSKQVLEVIERENLPALQTWADDQLPAGLLDALRQAGVRVTHESDPSLAGGLTGALAGVAESGTLVLTGGSGRPLSASLLPRIHLAVLRATDIVPRLPQALSLPAIMQASSTVLINGPSRTADIEMTMTIGMHGPGKLYVFCVQGKF